MVLSQLEVTGAEVYATEIGNELTKRGHKVVYASDTLTKSVAGVYYDIPFNKRTIKDRQRQLFELKKIIKTNDIQVLHAHSRASAWAAQIISKILGIPLITTVHGRQPVHMSRMFYKAYGDHTIAVCEELVKRLKNDFHLMDSRVSLLRNGIEPKLTLSELDAYKNKKRNLTNSKPNLAVIGRLSGPKGEAARKYLSTLDLDKYNVRVIGGQEFPEKFNEFKSKVDFLGYVDSLAELYLEADVVIGAGRVAVEAGLTKRPVIAIGESKYLGLITEDNLDEGLGSSFGDVGEDLNIGELDATEINNDIERALVMPQKTIEYLYKQLSKEYNLETIVENLESLYNCEIKKKLQRKNQLKIERSK